jgi:hypothetical protein
VDYLPNHDFPGSQRLEDTPEIYGEIDTAMKNGIPVLTQTTGGTQYFPTNGKEESLING